MTVGPEALARLVAALKPFARMARLFGDEVLDAQPILRVAGERLTVGDIRRARAALDGHLAPRLHQEEA